MYFIADESSSGRVGGCTVEVGPGLNQQEDKQKPNCISIPKVSGAEAEAVSPTASTGGVPTKESTLFADHHFNRTWMDGEEGGMEGTGKEASVRVMCKPY